jgi:hypothetical protein
MWLSASSDSARTALALTGTSGHRDGKTFVEFLSFIDCAKRAIRLVCGPSDVEHLNEAATALGFSVAVSDRSLTDVSVNAAGDRYQKWDTNRQDSSGERAIYLARSTADVKELSTLDSRDDDEALARFLGYPICCCDDRRSIAGRGDWWLAMAEATSTRSRLPSLMNRMSTLYSSASFLYDYFPCAYDCAHSANLARENRHRLIRHGCSELVAAWDRSQQGMFVIQNDVIYRSVSGKADSDLRAVFGLDRTACVPLDTRDGILIYFQTE